MDDETAEIQSFEYSAGTVAEFPYERFMVFLSRLKVQSKDAGLIPFRLLGSQRYILDRIREGLKDGVTSFFICKSRQVGCTTLLLAIDMFWAFNYKGLLGTFVIHREEARDDWRQAIDIFYEEIPAKTSIDGVEMKFKPRMLRHNRNILSFSNGSRFRYLIAGTAQERRGGLGRSGASNFVHMSEVAFYGNESDIQAFKSSLSSIYPHRLFVFESTANGFNHFYDSYTAAKSSPASRAIFVGWWMDDRNLFQKDSVMYSSYMPVEQLTQLERQRVRDVKKAYDVDVTFEQIAWYRWKIRDDFADDQVLMDEEFPWCVVGNTRVGTSRGIIPIAEAAIGDAGTHGEVKCCGPTGTVEVFTATTALGYRLTGTANHPLALVDGGFNHLEYCEGMTVRLCVPRAAAEPYVLRWREGVKDCAITITPDLARLVGIYMGDGSIQRGALSIACDAKDVDLVAEVQRLIRDLFGLDAQLRQVGVNSGCTEIRLSSMLVYETFRSMGLTRTDKGLTQRKVHVPEFIWRSPLPVIKEFLSGLFEADGYNGYKFPKVIFFSMYPEFLADIQLLLLAFGITCRRTSRPAKNRTASDQPYYYYTAHELTLRSEEATAFNERIGFISERKRLRYVNIPDRKPRPDLQIPMRLLDVVEKVEAAGTAEVFNLTIEPDHVFDANGFLTHNTDEDSFQATGSQYFTSPSLTAGMRQARQCPCQGYHYRLGMRWEDTSVHGSLRLERADLRIWDHSSKFGYYVLGCDPAYGSSDSADRSVISVWRCFADRIVQVAEYCTSQASTYQCAWVLAHLAGFYGQVECRVILEITGPGTAVFQELQMLVQRVREIPRSDDRDDLRNIFKHLNQYLYRKADSVGGSGLAFHWKMTQDLKQRLFAQFKNGFELGRAVVRSVPLIEEMRHVVNDEGYVGAEGTNKDDRVIAACLAYEAWRAWSQAPLRAKGYTQEVAMAIEEAGGEKPMDRLIIDYLKAQRIMVGAPARIRQPWELRK